MACLSHMDLFPPVGAFSSYGFLTRPTHQGFISTQQTANSTQHIPHRVLHVLFITSEPHHTPGQLAVTKVHRRYGCSNPEFQEGDRGGISFGIEIPTWKRNANSDDTTGIQEYKMASWGQPSSRVAIADTRISSRHEIKTRPWASHFFGARRVREGVTKLHSTRTETEGGRAIIITIFLACITDPYQIERPGRWWWSISRPSTRAAKVVSGFGEAGQGSAGGA